jgi:hypothetical protein
MYMVNNERIARVEKKTGLSDATKIALKHAKGRAK